MSKIKNGGLGRYGAGPFERQQFGTAGVEGVKSAATLFPLVLVNIWRRCRHGMKYVPCKLLPCCVEVEQEVLV